MEVDFIDNTRPLKNLRNEKTARLIASGHSFREAWRMTHKGGKVLAEITCISKESRMKGDKEFWGRVKYLDGVEKAKASEDDHEKMSKRLWEIINGSGGDVSKDADVIRAISELAKLKERAMSLEEAKANVASVVVALSEIVKHGIGEYIAGHEDLLVRKLGGLLGCGVAVYIGGKTYKSWNDGGDEEGEEVGNAGVDNDSGIQVSDVGDSGSDGDDDNE